MGTYLSSLLPRKSRYEIAISLWTHCVPTNDGTDELSLGEYKVSNLRENP